MTAISRPSGELLPAAWFVIAVTLEQSRQVCAQFGEDTSISMEFIETSSQLMPSERVVAGSLL